MFPSISAYGQDRLMGAVISVLSHGMREAMYRINKICMLAEFVI